LPCYRTLGQLVSFARRRNARHRYLSVIGSYSLPDLKASREPGRSPYGSIRRQCRIASNDKSLLHFSFIDISWSIAAITFSHIVRFSFLSLALYACEAKSTVFARRQFASRKRRSFTLCMTRASLLAECSAGAVRSSSPNTKTGRRCFNTGAHWMMSFSHSFQLIDMFDD